MMKCIGSSMILQPPAVVSLPVLSELCLPLSKGVGLLAMKGPDSQEELEKALGGIPLLGGALKSTVTYALPDSAGRTLFVLENHRKRRQNTPESMERLQKRL